MGRLWTTELDHSPLDVVAWHGNAYPYKYDLSRFNAINNDSDPGLDFLSSHPTTPQRVELARADAARHPVRKVVPWVEQREGSDWLCIPDDLGYPVTAEPLDTARRF